MKSFYMIGLLFFVSGLFLVQAPKALEENLLVQAVEILASKDFEGRGTGSAGNDKATDYLSNTLTQLGVTPLKKFKNHRQSFTVFTKMVKNGDNKVSTFGSIFTRPGFEPLSFSLSGDLKATDLVFAGFGISIPVADERLIYDDYKGLDVEGKIVVVFTGDPGIGNGNSPFRHPKYFPYRSVHYKLKNAILHKAKGILFVQDPMSLNDPSVAPDLFFNNRDGGGSRFSIIAGQVKHTWLTKVLSSEGHVSSLEIQKTISATQKPFSFGFESVKTELSVHLKKETGRVSNVVAYLPGSDDLLKNEVIVVGAHFDHLGYGGANSMETDRTPKIHFGADDNASGSAIILELVKRFKNKEHKRSIAFVLFNAEEVGLLGSKYFVDSWARYEDKYGKIVSMLNFDMVGRYENELAVIGLDSAFEWSDEVESLMSTIDQSRNSDMLLNMRLQGSSLGSSDHQSFIDKKIPSLFFTTGAHIDYHRSSDTVDKINYSDLNKITFFAENLVTKVSSGTKLTFDPAVIGGVDDGGRDRGYGAHLGCVPSFGSGDDIVGVLCSRMVPMSPAQVGGMVGGDIIRQIGDIEINNIYDLSFALKYYRAGDRVLLKWERDGKILSKEIILTSKK